jgi:hypothetical protein
MMFMKIRKATRPFRLSGRGPEKRTTPMWEWSISPGECERCHAYVPQLARCQDCGGPWLCDECAEGHECGG